jgi:hypothetical protein
VMDDLCALFVIIRVALDLLTPGSTTSSYRFKVAELGRSNLRYCLESIP